MLSECLASVIRQTMPAHQVMVIDDGSTDDTEARVAHFGSAVQYLRKANGGKSSALNAALPLVTGEFVWIFDDDDVALPSSIEDRVAAFDANPGADVVISRHYWGASANDGRIEARELAPWPDVDNANLLLSLMRGCFTTLQGTLARTECYSRIGAFREDLLRSQDYDVLVRLARSCHVVRLDRPTFVFRRHDGERGPAALRHAASEKDKHWAKYDALFGQDLRRTASLGEFLAPAVTRPLTAEQIREALLNRMSVMASKGLGREFMEDAIAFANACAQDGVLHLSADERRLAISSVQERHFLINVVPQSEHLVRARELASLPTGRSLLRAFSRGLVGVAKWGTRSTRQRRQILAVAARLAWLGWVPRTPGR